MFAGLFADYPVRFFSFYKPGDEKENISEEGKYYVTGYAAKLIHTILKNSGFSISENINPSHVIVGGKLEKENKSIRNRLQRQNHFEMTFSLGSKSGYHQVMKKFEENYGFMPSFYPESYSLPGEYSELCKAFSKYPIWISKPGGGSRGNGITVIDKLPKNTNMRMIIQKYIPNPLLIDGFKFDLRFYVAVTSLEPLKIYCFNNGLVRLATEKYVDNLNDLSNRSAHLTNFSINKESENFHVTNDISEDGQGNKWSHEPFWPWLQAQGFDIDEIKGKIESAFVTTILASLPSFLRQRNPRNSFELFGFDVMITQDGDINILEVNVSPALGTSSALDMYVKAPMVRDLFNIALICNPNEFAEKYEDIIWEKVDNNVLGSIVICEYEESQLRLGGFKCIYPTKNSVEKLLQFHPNLSYEDEVLHKWVIKSDEERMSELPNHISLVRNALSK